MGSISWAYILALSLIAMTWAIAFAYVRYSERTLRPLGERAAERASR